MFPFCWDATDYYARQWAAVRPRYPERHRAKVRAISNARRRGRIWTHTTAGYMESQRVQAWDARLLAYAR
jgi:C1A family cysteine protease